MKIFRTFSFWFSTSFALTLVVLTAVYAAWLEGHWWYNLLRQEVTDKQDLGELMAIESIKWFLGFAGLAAIGLYNLHRQDKLAQRNLDRADKKDRTARQADFVYKWSGKRLDTLADIHSKVLASVLLAGGCDVALTPEQFVAHANQLSLHHMEVSKACSIYGYLPFDLRNDEMFMLTHYYVQHLDQQSQSMLNLRNAKFASFNKDAVEAARKEIHLGHVNLTNFITRLQMIELRRQFICNSLPYEDWPVWVRKDLDFLAGLEP